jgi:hypothetical protein
MSDLKTLTAADITRLLSSTRERGGHDAFLREFNDSGEMYAILNSHPRYSGKTKEQLISLKNQLSMKAKALDLTNIKLVKHGDDIIIVNTALVVNESE